MTADALLDSNVVIAAVAEAHEHHAASLALFSVGADAALAVGSHSYAEAFSTLTRRGDLGPFRFSAAEAWAALESVRAVTTLVGLTAAQVFDAVRSFAHTGGIGPRLYDRLIGEAATIHGIPVLVSWNVGHMRNLFPALTVITPKEFSRTPSRP